jgi:DNA repair photolyase
MILRSGLQEALPYSLSRWTDVPAAKWDWFKAQLAEGHFTGFDPRTAMPARWSLKPEDTLGLIFWTKNPENLIRDAKLLDPYATGWSHVSKLVIHMTLTGWEEVEKGAPDITEGLKLLRRAVENYGIKRVTWRFSPVPMVDDVLDRFERIAHEASRIGLKEVYVAFLQENDLMPENRSRRVRVELLKKMAVKSHGIRVLLCNEDKSLQNEHMKPNNLDSGICESGARFVHFPDVGSEGVRREGCGCALAVDPFTINESCTLGCKYCYAADKTLADKKRNTTKHSLPLV